jgi:hypothetical protein
MGSASTVASGYGPGPAPLPRPESSTAGLGTVPGHAATRLSHHENWPRIQELSPKIAL